MTRAAKQFSVFQVDRPGVLSQVCDALARDKVNLVALSMMDSNEHGVLRLVVEDEPRAATTLKRLNLPMSQQEVLLAELPNKPGALADVCGRLGAQHIAITYAYCTGGAANGRTLAVLRVSDLPKALKLLDGGKSRHRETASVRPRGRR